MQEDQLTPCTAWQEKLATDPADLVPVERANLTDHVEHCQACAVAFANYQTIHRSLYAPSAEKYEEKPPAEWQRDDLPILPAWDEARRDNLPPRPGKELLGRQKELEDIREALDVPWLFLAIEGMAGVGKTTLALEVAHSCLERADPPSIPLFDAAVWISASARRLEDNCWLNEILNVIARVLEYPSIIQLSLVEKCKHIRKLLRMHQTLIIIDNFDAIDDAELHGWIHSVPLSSKVLVTTRDARHLQGAWTLSLKGLEGDEALQLIHHHASRLGLTAIERAHAGDLLNLVKVTRGNPQAIAMVLGNTKNRGCSLAEALDGLYNTGDVLDHLFMRSWDALARNTGTRAVLLAMPFFADSASGAAINAVASLDSSHFERALTRLKELSLLEVRMDELSTRYSLHPLTRAFVEARLAELPAWEQEARKRWINWWLTFTQDYGGPDGAEWARGYDLIDQEWANLLLVFEWCATHDHYKTLHAFWSPERLLSMTSLYGYWKERIYWLNWLRLAAEQRQDWATAVEAIAEQGFTLVQQGYIEEADRVFKMAWEQRHYASADAKLTLAGNIVQRYIRTNDFTSAEDSLKIAYQLLNAVYLPRVEYQRHMLTFRYYSGIIFIARRDYNRAEVEFQLALEGTREIGWQRGMVYVQQFLADIARARRQYAEAEELLRSGLAIVERNKDWRRAAYYKRSLAYLALKRYRRRKPDEVIYWARPALDDFAHLGMLPEVNRLRHLLKHLQGETTRSTPLRLRFTRDSCSTMGDLPTETLPV